MNFLHRWVGSAGIKIMAFPAHVPSSCLKGRFREKGLHTQLCIID